MKSWSPTAQALRHSRPAAKQTFATRPAVRTSAWRVRATATLAGLGLLGACAAWAGGVVSTPTEAALRAAMAGGGTVTFACDGTITLANTITNTVDTVLDGTGHQVLISGGNTVRVFYLAPSVTFTLLNLTIANGYSTKGAGVYNDGGTLNLVGTTLARNRAYGIQQPGYVQSVGAEGGAVFNGGSMSAVSGLFSNNSAYQPSWNDTGPSPPVMYPVRQALGGAIRNLGTLVLQDCILVNNQATGADGNWPIPLSVSLLQFAGLDGHGGAIHSSGSVTIVGCSFLRNAATGGAGAGNFYGTALSPPIIPGGSGGSATGGAVESAGSLSIRNSAIVSNTAAGGYGGSGQNGYQNPQTYARGPGGPAGLAGGADGCALFISQGVASAVNTTFAGNSSAGGRGGFGGRGRDAYFNNEPGTDGGAGNNGGSASGAIVGGPYLTNCTVAFNSAVYGVFGTGGPGGLGRGIGTNGAAGANGGSGTAGGGGLNNAPPCVNTLLATNVPGGNSSVAPTDLGHNLSSDSTCAFHAPGSMNSTDPKLGPLTSNGGPTLTMALLPGSPAADTADPAAAPLEDQRGYPRPACAGPDIGAFEYGSVLPFLSLSPSGPGALDILLHANSNQWCRLLSSSNCSTWCAVATNQIGSDGTLLLHQTNNAGENSRFYRMAMP